MTSPVSASPVASAVAPAGKGPAAAPVPWYLLLGLVLLPLVVFSSSLGHGLLGLDDELYFQGNPLLHGGAAAGLRDLWTRPYFDDYAPITQLTIWLDLAWSHGGSFVLARVQHLLWMGVGALAVLQLMRRLTGRIGVAWAVALLYALHPVSAEAALWLAERKNLVALALTLWSIERHIAWRQGAGWGALAASLLLCPLALLAKAHAVIIPAVITCHEVILGDGSPRRRLLAILPSGLLTAAFVAICVWCIHLYHGIVQSQVGGSLPASVLCDGAILARYLMHVVLPHHLALFYRVVEDPHRWRELLGWWLGVLGVVAASIALVRREDRRLAVLAWCAAGCSILPAINLKPLPVPMADHYLQWSLPWLLLVLTLVAGSLLERARSVEWQRPAWWITAGYAVFLLLMSIARVPEFANRGSVARTGVINQGDCAINWGMYCAAHEHQSPPDLEEAGRAGIMALRCSDYHRIFGDDLTSCAITGFTECRRLYGDQAAAELLARALTLMNPQVQCYTQGTLLFTDGRFGDAATVLARVYTPPLRATAHAVGELCRSGEHQPWELPAAQDPEDRRTLDAHSVYERNGFSFRIFSLLSASYCRIGDAPSAFDLAALLVNMDPDNADALSVYVDACRQIGLPRSAEQARSRLAARPAAATD